VLKPVSLLAQVSRAVHESMHVARGATPTAALCTLFDSNRLLVYTAINSPFAEVTSEYALIGWTVKQNLFKHALVCAIELVARGPLLSEEQPTHFRHGCIAKSDTAVRKWIIPA
jgi:hypothetical protein